MAQTGTTPYIRPTSSPFPLQCNSDLTQPHLSHDSQLQALKHMPFRSVHMTTLDKMRTWYMHTINLSHTRA